MGLRLAVFIAAVCLFAILIYWQRPSSGEDAAQLSSNILLFALVNLNVVIICVLAFLVGRNIVKLIFDRRRNILGTKIRMRLVVAFVGLTLIPTTILFFLASGLLTKSMEGWFSNYVESTVEGAVEVARQHFSVMRILVRAQAERVATQVAKYDSLEALKKRLEADRTNEDLFALRLVRPDKSLLLEVQNAAGAVENFREPDLDDNTIVKALRGEIGVIREETEGSTFIRAYAPVMFRGEKEVLIVSSRVTPELALALSSVNESFKQYEQLKLFQGPLKSGYLLTFTMITALLLFSAMWIGLYLAKEISVPIQRLAEGTDAVARGNYDFQIKAVGDDEISFLISSFNKMTSDLKSSQLESERRRLYIETILSNLAVGVIGLDSRRVITSFNDAARRIYGFGARSLLDDEVNDGPHLIGRQLTDVLGADRYGAIEPLLLTLEEKPENRSSAGERIAEQQLRITTQGRELNVLCTGGRISDREGRWLGTVLLFDDITELAKAQSMAAWREVAKRIAHEIKNPLTPIQLSSQRLQRILGEADLGPVVSECVQTIVENVDSIKRLANEFSNFARMPTAEFKEADLNQIVSEAVTTFASLRPNVVFQFVADSRIPLVRVDPEQIRRVLINLVDNAVDALAADAHKPQDLGEPKVVLKTYYDRRTKRVSLEVSDNGPGIDKDDKLRIFEPYFTTKGSGTGLGLAIVTTIIADHQGEIKVYDNTPRGAKFVVDLPIAPKHVTHRRFADGRIEELTEDKGEE